jgi:hypothetical protein
VGALSRKLGKVGSGEPASGWAFLKKRILFHRQKPTEKAPYFRKLDADCKKTKLLNLGGGFLL